MAPVTQITGSTSVFVLYVAAWTFRSPSL